MVGGSKVWRQLISQTHVLSYGMYVYLVWCILGRGVVVVVFQTGRRAGEILHNCKPIRKMSDWDNNKLTCTACSERKSNDFGLIGLGWEIRDYCFIDASRKVQGTKVIYQFTCVNWQGAKEMVYGQWAMKQKYTGTTTNRETKNNTTSTTRSKERLKQTESGAEAKAGWAIR